MKTTRTKFRAIALVLAMATVFLSVSFTVVAEDSTVINQNEIITDVTEEVSFGNPDEFIPAVYEVEDLREENVKHFSLPDGTYQAVSYGGAVHRKNEDGEWVDIDNRLVSSGSDYATEDGRISFVKAPISVDGGSVLYTLTEGDYMLTVGIMGTDNRIMADDNAVLVGGAQIENHPAKPEILVTDSAEEQLSKLRDIDNTTEILYEDILDGTDIEYVLTGNDVKENIIVKEKRDSYTYTFAMIFKDLTAESTEDGSIILADIETGEPVYYIPAPYMYDAAGEISYAVSYTLEEDEQNIYTLAVTADETWINADDRAFPVVIDPTVTEPHAFADTYISSSRPNTVHGYETTMMVSEADTAFIQIDTPIINTNLATVTSATLCVPYFLNTTNGSVNVGVYGINELWDEGTATYANSNNIFDAQPSERITLSTLAANGVNTLANPLHAYFDVFTPVWEWYHSETDDFWNALCGFAFSYESGTDWVAYLGASESGVDATLIVNYKYNYEGLYHIKDENYYLYLYGESDYSLLTEFPSYVSNTSSDYGDFLWGFEHISGGYYKITSLSLRDEATKTENMALTASDAYSVDIAAYTGADSQKWLVEKDGTGITISNKAYPNKYLSNDDFVWELSGNEYLLYNTVPDLHNSYWYGTYNRGIDELGDLHIKVVIDPSVLLDNIITADMFDVVEYWEEVCDRVHIYMPDETAPAYALEVKFLYSTISGLREKEMGRTEGISNLYGKGIHYDWDRVEIQINKPWIRDGLNFSEPFKSEAIEKTILHEMGHALKLSHLKDTNVEGYYNQKTILAVMNQGAPYSDVDNISTNYYAVIYPSSHDIYSLKQKWGWN